jgi:hypothetical protein
MGVTILICTCGQRVRAPGAKPGRVGRCPACGGRLEVAPRTENRSPHQSAGIRPSEPDSHEFQRGEPAGGYSLQPEERTETEGPRRKRVSSSPSRVRARGSSTGNGAIDHRPMSDGLLPPLSQPETGFMASVLYPLRGAEAMAMIVIMAIVFWCFTILVPEYCLSVWADANALGTPSMGMLVILISGLPALLLLPLTLIYLLQYLGRVLVSTAMGETVPPRTPDRNFDGFFTGLSPWFAWLILGFAVGLLPLGGFVFSLNQPLLGNLFPIGGLIVFSLPYMMVALMMSFLHDHPLAATPSGVIGVLLRHGGPFAPTLLKVSALLGFMAVAISVTLLFRAGFFWGYIFTALGCWAGLIWAMIVGMRILGLHYFHHKESLRWHHDHPRWGVSWRL